MNKQEAIWFEKLHAEQVNSAKEFMKPRHRGFWTSVIEKYPDSAHFIYELLQNADDAKATVVEIMLKKKGLLFKHNGTTHFTVSSYDTEEKDRAAGTLGHVNSITAIGFSTKDNEGKDNKIGKFGVGFKAVFQYTNTPEIYDDNVCFRILDYIVPEEIKEDHPWRKKGETLFFLPFNRENMTAKQAYSKIEGRLKTLKNPILFLHNIKEITWSSDTDGVEGMYRKDVTETCKRGNILCERVSAQSFSADEPDDMWLFTRVIEVDGKKHPISVGYYIDDDKKVDTTRKPKIFCFFPTIESFGFCFVMHAPFVLVDSRQLIKRDDENNNNRELFKQLSALAADALVCLCDIGQQNKKYWVDENIFNIVPLEERYEGDDEEADAWYNFFYSSFWNVMAEEKVHLSTEKKYVLSEKAVKMDNSLIRLLTPKQYAQLTYNEGFHFVYPKLSISQYQLAGYIDDIGIETFDVDKFGRAYYEGFIHRQNDEWILKFYKFLASDEGRRLIERYQINKGSTSNAALLYKPFIRTQKKTFVAPYTSDNKPNVFIDDGSPKVTEMNYVDPVLYAEKDTRKLIERLKLGAPDSKSIVENVILPKYKGNDYVSDEQYIKDFAFILEVWHNCSSNDASNLIKLSKEMLNFKVLGGKYCHVKDLIYEKSDEILMVREKSEDVHVIDRAFYLKSVPLDMAEKCNDFLDKFDFNKYINISKVSVYRWRDLLNRKGDISSFAYELESSSSRYPESTFFYDYRIHTFDSYCQKGKVTPEYSFFIWKSIMYHYKMRGKTLLNGTCTFFYYSEKAAFFESEFSISIHKNKWLYNANGKLCKPSEVYIEDLDERYEASEEMYELLGMSHTPQTRDIQLISEQCSATTLEATKIGQELQKCGIKSVEDVREYAEWKKEKAKQEEARRLAEERRKQEEEERAKLRQMKGGDEDFLMTHKQKNYSVEETFDRQTLQKPTTPKPAEAVVETISDEQIQEIKEREEENKRLREIAADETKKYTYEWFNALLELEFQASGEENRNKKGIELYFSKVEKDPYSEQGVLLKNPSGHIPIAIEEMSNISVTFRLPEGAHQTIIFEVASVQDYVLRLKGKNEDAEKLDDLLSLSHKIYRAELKTGSPVQLIAKLQEAFSDLGFEDGYSMLENINPELKFIFGPPGTGKTTYLVKKWINQIAIRPKGKMLVLCPTNKAADVIAQRALSMINPASRPENWLFRFVATNEDGLANNVCSRDSDVWQLDKCCVISTIARFAYDGFAHANLKDIDWDYVVIDEASMIPLAQILYPIYRCEKAQIVISGDPLQIEPIVHEDLWKDENIYKMVNLENFKDPQTRPVQFDIVNLPTQYRAVPAIGDLYSKYAYQGGVSSNRKQSSQKPITLKGYDVKSVNFITFAVDRMQSIFSAQNVLGSNVHIYSALFAFEFTQYVASQLKAGEKGKPWRIGIISPYRAQAEVINKLWEQREQLLPQVEVSIGTVHGFQGDECDIIIAVYNPPAYGLKKFADRTFINKRNILNVAISRAQDYLFILMPDKDYEHFDTLQAKNIGVIARENVKELTLMTAQKMEKVMFNDDHHIEKNTFVTMHQLANVYTAPSSLYEVRIDEKSIDIQVKR